jgi:hypothetical protein
MKLIHPFNVTGRLLALIREAKEELVIVSPSINLTYWQQPATAIKQALARGVIVTCYICGDAGSDVSQSQVEQLGLTPILVENLHARIYYNEADGIVTSMSLRHTVGRLIEIGSQVETPAELAELRRIVRQVVAPHQVPVPPPLAPKTASPVIITDSFAKLLLRRLRTSVDENASVEEAVPGELTITALRNSFTLHVIQPANEVQIAGIISQREASSYKRIGKQHFIDNRLRYQLLRRSEVSYNRIAGTYLRKLASPSLNQLAAAEAEGLLDAISSFISVLRAFKDEYC